MDMQYYNFNQARRYHSNIPSRKSEVDNVVAVLTLRPFLTWTSRGDAEVPAGASAYDHFQDATVNNYDYGIHFDIVVGGHFSGEQAITPSVRWQIRNRM